MGRWIKLGQIVQPNPTIGWMSRHVAAAYVDSVQSAGLKMFVAGRDQEGISRIGTIEFEPDDLTRPCRVSPQPVFDVGELGCFDERGVAYPWLVRCGSSIFLYYVGWVAGGLCGFQNMAGLAISEDNGHTFRRVSRAPILERTDREPIGTGSVCVLRETDVWRLWYTCFVRWEKHNGAVRHYYHIRYAESDDGIHWRRDGQVAIDFEHSNEYAIGKPMVLCEDNLFRMWYSFRGSSYRIGYAESSDGKLWRRMDQMAGIDVSEQGWDHEMVEYPYVFDYRDDRYLIYTGNGYGRTGLGLAVWERASED